MVQFSLSSSLCQLFRSLSSIFRLWSSCHFHFLSFWYIYGIYSKQITMVLESLTKVPLSTGLRRMFYLVSPNETTFKTIEEVPQYISQSSTFFLGFVLIEFIISAVKNDGRRKLNDSLTSIAAGMFSRLPHLMFKSFHIVAYVWVYEHCRVYDMEWNSQLAWWICFFAVDCGYYWFHRLAHEMNYMWAAHQVHHSSEYYNFSTALRQSVLQQYTSWIFYLPLALFIPPPIYVMHQELNILYQFWIHTEYVKSLGPLEYIMNTPSHHRVHHGRNRYCIDKNYAGTLIIWDRMFGTFEPENEEVVYGLTHPVETFDQFQVQFGFCQYVIGRFCEFKSFGDRIRTLLYGPGWGPGKPRTGELEDIPDVHAPAVQYDPKVPAWLQVYVLVHFLLTLTGFQLLMEKKQLFCQTYMLMFIIYIGYCLSTFGRLFDRKKSGVIMEVCRCLVFLIGDILLIKLGFYAQPSGPDVMPFLRLFFVASLGVWLVLYQKVFDAKVVLVNKHE